VRSFAAPEEESAMARTDPIIRLRPIAEPPTRRSQPRSPCDLDVSVRPVGSQPGYFWTARVWDLSAVGISFYLKERIAPGTVLEVEIIKGETVARKLLARVAHATDHANGSWIIGCEFDRPLTEPEVQALTTD
jgi:hypothetical protein